jgi:O-antigen/teichoic acid export membrane protein
MKRFTTRLGHGLPILTWAIPLALTLIATPAVVHGLGPSAYGAYSIVAALAAFAVLPPGAAAVSRFTASAGEETPNINDIVLVVAAVMLAAVLVNILVIGAIDTFIGLNLPLASTSEHLLLFASLTALLFYAAMNQVFFAVLQYRGRWMRAAGVMLVSAMATPLIAFLLVKVGADWLTIVAFQAGWAVLGIGALFALYGSSASDRPARQTARPSPKLIIGFMSRTGLAAAIGSAMAIAERLVLSARMGPDAAGRFGLAISLAIMIQGAMYSANMRLPAALSHAMATGKVAAMEPTYRFAMRQTIAAVGLALTLILALGRQFFSLFLGAQLAGPISSLLPPLAIGIAALAVAVPPWMLADVTGSERTNIGLMAALLVTWAIAAAILVPAKGAEGMALARLTVPFCVGLYIMTIEKRAFARTDRSFWLSVPLRTVLAALACFMVMKAMPLGGWLGLFATATAGSVAYFLVAGLTHLVRPSEFLRSSK